MKTNDENNLCKEAFPNGFYLLSPDGFTLIPDAEPYSSIEDARKDFDDWVKRFEKQGYYSSSYGKIDLEDLWDCMIINEDPFYIP